MQSLQVARMSRALKAMSDSNRIRILEILVTGEYCVSDLVEKLQIDQPKVSHHLAILRSAGVIKSRRDGRHINYSLKPAVHRQLDTPEGPSHLFDLVDLCVTFRFPVPGTAPAGQAATQPGHAPQTQGAEHRAAEHRHAPAAGTASGSGTSHQGATGTKEGGQQA